LSLPARHHRFHLLDVIKGEGITDPNEVLVHRTDDPGTNSAGQLTEGFG
jgi:hypothetical protein